MKVKPSVLLTISLVLVVLYIAFNYFRATPVAQDLSSQKKSSLALDSLHFNQATGVINLMECLDLDIKLESMKFLETLINKYGAAREVWHWDNLHFDNAKGEKMIFHIVPEQNQDGHEYIALKIFKEAGGIPQLLEEKAFASRAEALSVAKKLHPISKNDVLQNVESYQFSNGLEVKTNKENQKLIELEFRSEHGLLNCEIAAEATFCDCR